jgi:hypothetical protein
MHSRWLLTLLLVIAGSMLSWSASQARDNPSCEKACLAEERQCINVCSEYPNPIECEADCRKTAQKCRHTCRH